MSGCGQVPVPTPKPPSGVGERVALLTGQSVPVLQCVCTGRSNAIAALFMRGDPANPDLNCGIRLAVSRSVPTVDPMLPRCIVDSRAVSVCRNSHGTQRDHARKAKCEPPAQAG